MHNCFQNEKCLVCNTKTIKLNYEIEQCVSSDGRGINTALSHLFCLRCGYIFVDFSKRMDYEKFYISDYKLFLDSDDLEPTFLGVKYSENLVEFYQEYLLNDANKNFFDIGAGKGNFVQSIHNKFPDLNITALEPGKAYKKLQNKKFIKKSYNCFFDSNNFTSSFDYLSLIGVLEHVSNPKLFLLDLRKIMNDDSLLLIEVPNFKNFKSDLLTIDHLSKFTEESLTNLLAISGFDIIKKRVMQSVPMQYIVKKRQGNSWDFLDTHIEYFLNSAVRYIKKARDEARTLNKKSIAIYGQGLVLQYLLNTNILSINNIACIIDDNVLYQGKKYQDEINIVDYITFNEKYPYIDSVFLAMNGCYHNIVKGKLGGVSLYGVEK